MFNMVQKCSQWRVFNVFVEEPLKIHHIKEISRKIDLAPTSVRNHLDYLFKKNLISKRKGERFFGFIANRDNEDFLFYKKIMNLINLRESKLLDYLINSIYPQAVVLYGSYIRGEDVEKSDIDLIIITKIKKRLDLKKFEIILKRGIHILFESGLKKLSIDLRNEVINGLVLYGYLKYDYLKNG